ncbi:MAG TPA: hypothetical protein VJP77_01735 [Planctomycetota bacterium]|nr:hypothetical protein [Planctomycetota bacterium]
MKLRLASRCRSAGFTVIEVAIGTVVLLLLIGTVAESMSSMRRATFTGSAQSIGHEQAERALGRIVDDLRRSGFTMLDELEYPYVFEGGNLDAGYDAFAEHGHAPADEHADADEADFGPDQEILFVLPEDADGDGAPDIDDDTGMLVWNGAVEISYTLVTLQDGTNVLQRRVTGDTPRTIARGVERLRFDTPETAGFQIPLGTVRVRLWFRTTDGTGTEHRTTAEAVVRLRNGDGL